MATWGSGVSFDKNLTGAVGYDTVTRDGTTLTVKWGSRVKSSWGSFGFGMGGCSYWKLGSSTGGNKTKYYGKGASGSYTKGTWYYTKNGETSAKAAIKTARYDFTATTTLSSPEAGTITLESWVWTYDSTDGYPRNASPTVSVSYPAAATCTITFDDQSGSGGPGSQNFYKGYAQNLSSTIPTRSGYTFQGWYTGTGGSGTQYTPGTSYTITSSFVLYAYWTKTVYTNTIDHWTWGYVNGEGNNGNHNAYKLASTTFTATYESSYTMNSSRAVAVPRGFSLNNNFGTSYISGSWASYAMPTTVTQKASAADFEYDYNPISYSISYVLNGGSHSGNPTSYNILYGKTLSNATRTGYNFTGWKQTYTIPNITLSANTGNWNYTAMVYQVQPSDQFSIVIGQASVTAGSASQFSVLIYDFTNNASLASTTGSFGSNRTITINTPSSADGTHDIRVIIYAGVAGSTANIGATYSNITINNTSSYINRYSNATFSSPDDLRNKTNVRNIGNITANALWTAKTFTVTFNANGGTVSPTSKTVTYASTYGTLPTPTRAGYKFLGWFTSSSGGSQITSSTTVTITAAQTLWAHWECIVSLKTNNGWVTGIIYIKTNSSTWQQAQHVFVKTSSGWKGY